jgi:ssDNA-binding Zn-finger/Zn-ribbon topoisomerase 1
VNCGEKRVITENKSVRGDDSNPVESAELEESSPSFTAPDPEAPLAADVEPSSDGEYRDAIIMSDEKSGSESNGVTEDVTEQSPTEPSDSAVVISNKSEAAVSTDSESNQEARSEEESDESLPPVPGVTPENATVLSHSSGAIAWKDGDSPGETDEPVESSGPKRRIQKGGKSVQCPACGYVENQHVANLIAGDACPECRRAYLNWYEPVEGESEGDEPVLPQMTPAEKTDAAHSEPSDSAMFID